jgi:predicted alpha/beta-hydrolase family hydrolase
MNKTHTNFSIGNGGNVSGLLDVPETARACLVLAHGAGADMTHPFIETVASGLSNRGVATLRFQFPYMEKGSRRPDRPAVAEATVRAAVAEATRAAHGLPLFAGGKSFGGRMTSQAQAHEPMPGVRGLIFFGFPLHPASKPATTRGEHLASVDIPMLFLQGARDKLAEPELLRPLCTGLDHATLHLIEHADHSFHVPKRSGRSDEDVMTELVETSVSWMDPILKQPEGT